MFWKFYVQRIKTFIINEQIDILYVTKSFSVALKEKKGASA